MIIIIIIIITIIITLFLNVVNTFFELYIGLSCNRPTELPDKSIFMVWTCF